MKENVGGLFGGGEGAKGMLASLSNYWGGLPPPPSPSSYAYGRYMYLGNATAIRHNPPKKLTHCILVNSSTVICWTSPFVILGVSGLFCPFIPFLMETPVSKQCRLWSDVTCCGVWSGSVLFVYDPFTSKNELIERKQEPVVVLYDRIGPMERW